MLTQAQLDTLNSFPTFDGSGPNAGYGSWGGSFTYPDGTQAQTSAAISSSSVQARRFVSWITVSKMRQAGDFVNSSEGLDDSDTETDNVFLSFVWDSDGEVGPFEALQVRTNISDRSTSYTWHNDRDKGIVPGDNLGHVGLADGFVQDSKSFELIFDATLNDRVNFLAGVWWFDDEANTGTSDCWPLFRGPGGVQERVFEALDTYPGPTEGSIDEAFRDEVNALVGDTPCGPSTGGSGLAFQFLPLDLRLAAGTTIPSQLDAFGFGGSPHGAFQQVNTATESKAVFAHMNYAINDDWSSRGRRPLDRGSPHVQHRRVQRAKLLRLGWD